jgi:outer membrane protein TolC
MLDKQFKVLTAQYRQGFKTKSDFLRLKTQVQKAEIDRVGAENSIHQSEANLQKLLGVSESEAGTVSFAPLRLDVSKPVELSSPTQLPALSGTYEFQSSRLQRDSNRETVSLTRRNYWPQLSVTGGVSYLNQNYLNSPAPFSAGNQLSWNALLTLQYNLWDWGTRRRDLEIAELNEGVQDDSLDQGVLEVRAQLTGLMAELGRASRNFALSRELLELEQESSQNLELQYREGKVTYLDLITELNNLLDARVQYFTSYFDVLGGTVRYRYFEGKAYESVVQK